MSTNRRINDVISNTVRETIRKGLEESQIFESLTLIDDKIRESVEKANGSSLDCGCCMGDCKISK